jgi:hypothetical protein
MPTHHHHRAHARRPRASYEDELGPGARNHPRVAATVRKILSWKPSSNAYEDSPYEQNTLGRARMEQSRTIIRTC